MVATSGDPLLQPDAVAAYRELLFPLAAVVTPNLDEAAALLGGEIRSLDAMREAGRELAGRFGVPFLLKGGHLRGERAVDCLVAGGEIEEFEGPFFPGISTHGTGCTFSAAIAAGLAKGEPLREAVAAGKRFVAGAIARALRWGSVDALDHLGLGR
jgi:hydroxymethylpyrimidine/phosphomethylpyrimidine kinase